MTTTQLQKMEIKPSIYTLTKDWFDWCKENREKNNPTLSALYFWTIQKCNSLGWVEKFGLPTDEAMHVLGIGSYNTYKKNLLQLEEIGFIHILELSKNQWTSNIIALSNFDKALSKHLTKQVQSTVEALDKAGSKQVEYNKTNKTIKTIKTIKDKEDKSSIEDFPFTSQKFIDTFNSFLEMRKNMKKPATAFAQKLLKNELLKLSNNVEVDAIKILEKSILSGWLGVFALKVEELAPKPKQAPKPKNPEDDFYYG
jgi:hypothetical protein